jgi:hypothetical protein
MANCNICKRPLDDPSDPTTEDCGGDCLRCMAEVAEDPDCIERLAALYRPRDDGTVIAVGGEPGASAGDSE